jgi:hypothetical protein
VTSPPPGQPPYGEPQPGQPPYGPPPYGQTQYGPPPYGQPQYGQPYYGAQPPKSRRGLKIGLIIGGIVLLLCCGAAGVGGFVIYKLGTSPEAAADQWLDAVRTRDFPAAYDLLCAGERDRLTPAEFRGMFDGDNAVDSYEVAGPGRSADKRSEVRVRVTLANGRGPKDGVLVLVRESDGWRVCDTVGFG